MFERILVPLDGSQRAERAVPLAARVARATGGSLALLQALSVPGELVSFVAPALEPSTLGPDLDAAKGYLDAVAATIEGLTVETAVRSGPAPSAIAAFAREYNADAIMLCSHGEASLAHRVLGSVAERLVHSAPVPVLVLREQGPLPAEYAPEGEARLRVLVPLDGAPGAEEALLPAATLALTLAAPGLGTLDLLRVLAPGASGDDRDAAEGYLAGVVERLRQGEMKGLELPMAWFVAEGRDAAQAVLDVATGGLGNGGYDLVAIATPPADRAHHWPLGDAIERILRATKLALLLAHPPEGAGGRAAPEGAR